MYQPGWFRWVVERNYIEFGPRKSVRRIIFKPWHEIQTSIETRSHKSTFGIANLKFVSRDELVLAGDEGTVFDGFTVLSNDGVDGGEESEMIKG